MIRTMCAATLLVTIPLAGCSNEAPQHDFALDLGGDGATPLLPSVIPAYDEAILAQRSVASGSSPTGGRTAPAPTPPPAPVDDPAPNPSEAAAFGAPAGAPSRPVFGGTPGGAGTDGAPFGQAPTGGSAPANGDQGDAPKGGKLAGFLRQGIRAAREAPKKISGSASSADSPGSGP